MFTIRTVTIDDLPRLSLLLKVVYIETYALEGVSQEFTDFVQEQFALGQLEAKFADLNTKFWIAEFKGNLVGALQLEMGRKCPIQDIIAPEINKLYILRNFYSKGIGQSLLSSAEEYLRINKEPRVWLWTLSSNDRAVKFYSRSNNHDIGQADFQMAVNRYKNAVMLKEL